MCYIDRKLSLRIRTAFIMETAPVLRQWWSRDKRIVRISCSLLVPCYITKFWAHLVRKNVVLFWETPSAASASDRNPSFSSSARRIFTATNRERPTCRSLITTSLVKLLLRGYIARTAHTSKPQRWYLGTRRTTCITSRKEYDVLLDGKGASSFFAFTK